MTRGFGPATGFCVLASLLVAGCEPWFKNEWIALTEEESIAKLEAHFVYLPEMEILSGKTRGAEGALGFGEETYVYFKLPDTMVPADWLTYLAIQTEPDDETFFSQTDTHTYCHKAYTGKTQGGECSHELKFYEHEDVYHAKYYYPD